MSTATILALIIALQLIGRLDLGPGFLLGAAISAGRLVALRSSRLEAYDLATKRRVAVRRVSPASDLRLHDAERDLVVYSTGLELTVLDLPSGRRLTVALPEHAGPIGAALTTAGLYVGYNVPRVASPGRIGFVPRQRLAAGLR